MVRVRFSGLLPFMAMQKRDRRLLDAFKLACCVSAFNEFPITTCQEIPFRGGGFTPPKRFIPAATRNISGILILPLERSSTTPINFNEERRAASFDTLGLLSNAMGGRTPSLSALSVILPAVLSRAHLSMNSCGSHGTRVSADEA